MSAAEVGGHQGALRDVRLSLDDFVGLLRERTPWLEEAHVRLCFERVAGADGKASFAEFVDFAALRDHGGGASEALKLSFEQSGFRPPPREPVQQQQQPLLGAAVPHRGGCPLKAGLRHLLAEFGVVSAAVAEGSAEEEQQQVEGDAATDEVGGGRWWWGHSSNKERPRGCSAAVLATTALLPPFHRDMTRWGSCPSYVDHLAHGPGGAAAFVGGTVHTAHGDCARMLEEHCALWESGKLERRNELGFLVLDNGAFPKPHQTLGLGSPIDVHNVQRRYLGPLIARIPGRDTLIQEAHLFVHGRTRIEFPHDVDAWWTRLQWKYVVGAEVDVAFAGEFLKFRESWLSACVVHGGQVSLSDLTFQTEGMLRDQADYRNQILDRLPLEVPREHREAVAQAVLEMMCFAGGLSVPLTITAAVGCMHTGIMPEPVTEQNVEAFIYEVTRLFPAVQGFPYWKDGHRHILHLGATLRDPRAFGPDADKFTLKDLGVYRDKHLGFANLARSDKDDGNSRYCPGMQVALDAPQAFALVLSSWTYRHDNAAKPAWRLTEELRPAGRSTYMKPFALERDGMALDEQLLAEYQGLVDNTHTGESLFADFSPEEFVSFVERVDADLDGVPDSLSLMNRFTKVFYKLSLASWQDCCRMAEVEVPKLPAAPLTDDKSIVLPVGGVRMPKEDEQKPGADALLRLVKRALFFLNSLCDDSVHESLRVEDEEQRRQAIFMARRAFTRKGGGTYLPETKVFWEEFASDRAQGLLALFSLGQLELRRNADPRQLGLGEFVVDPLSRTLASIDVRDAEKFERLGGAAFFDRGEAGELRLSAIDWRHADRVVRPGDADWEHAKYVWRCALCVKVTAFDHLVWCHWIVANALCTSLRESFRADHPIRRLLHVNTYNTASVNSTSFWALYPENAFLHRTLPWEHPGLVAALNTAFSSFRYRTWPQAYVECDLPEDIKASMPMWEDGLTVWSIFREFYASYVNLYYESDSDVLSDLEVQQYWKFSSTPHYTRGLPPLSKDALIDQITHAVFWVCAYHEFVGGAVEYVTDPTGLFFQVRPGQCMADQQQMLQSLALTASTGAPMPRLSGDWAHLLDLGPSASINRYEEARVLFDRFQARLRAASAAIAERNKRRPKPFNAFDPMEFECSVSL